MAKTYEKPKPEACPHNEGVACYHTADCEGCGWNPDVAAKRQAELKAKLGIKEQEVE